ncbi:hypothetical protein [Pseudonocardia sp. NPDC046786]|uniref:hypothetical protein n=1 Tax=Pseudonocardia sp. NPDC046786 TaxID=3155471 RepID=UPI0033E25D8B
MTISGERPRHPPNQVDDTLADAPEIHCTAHRRLRRVTGRQTGGSISITALTSTITGKLGPVERHRNIGAGTSARLPPGPIGPHHNGPLHNPPGLGRPPGLTIRDTSGGPVIFLVNERAPGVDAHLDAV